MMPYKLHDGNLIFVLSVPRIFFIDHLLNPLYTACVLGFIVLFRLFFNEVLLLIKKEQIIRELYGNGLMIWRDILAYTRHWQWYLIVISSRECTKMWIGW